MRVTSAFWVSAFIRRCFSENAFAATRRKGADDAGAIWIILDDLNGNLTLFEPAPMLYLNQTMDDENNRTFITNMCCTDYAHITARLEKELRFDPDLWIVEVEAKDGKVFIPQCAEEK